MKALTVVLLASVAWSSGYLIKVPVAPIFQPALAPSGWIHLQKQVLPLFENVCEESNDPIICQLSQEEFTVNLSAADFWDPEVITRFQNLKSGKGFLPKGQIFSEYNVEHTNELKIVFDVMRNAKTFDTFYKVAAWARQNLNCGLYVNLIYLALENRTDTEKLTLPPPYELLPNYFIRKDIIIQGSSLLAGEEFTPSEGVRDEGNAFTLKANYTANFYDNDDESKLAYFREDIGLNSYYFLRMLKRAPWLNENVKINSRYGEEIFHMMKQLVARYNLERYSNGMPEQENLNWDSLSDAPYDPMLVYSNGNEFIHRTSSVQLPENEDKALLQTIESNIATVASHMRETGYNKTQILNHLMEILVTGERSYDALARHLLGKALNDNGQPSVFEHYMTSLRDPLIWRLLKKIVDLVDNALKILPPYTRSELYFPGVEVMSIDVKKMMTNFDYFEFDITEALKIGNGDTTFQVKIGQSRLNHKPFMVKLNISSLVTQKGLVKFYLGPKIMPGEFSKKKNMFNLIDCFEINIKRGSNIVTRTSNDMKMFSPDFTSLKTLSKKVEDAQFGLDSLPLNTIESQIGFPERLIIPKGTPEGLPLQLFVFVAPFMKATIGGAYSTSNMELNPEVLSPLYPLDLAMEDKILLDLPNALVKDVMVTHKGISKVSNYGSSGSSKSWYDKSNGPPPRPNMYDNGNEAFDYNARKSQFEQDENYQYFGSNNMKYNDDMQNDAPSTGMKENFLQTSGYDYSSKQKQQYDYKSKYPQFQKPDYSPKRVDYKTLYQDKSTEKPSENPIQNNMVDKALVNENQFENNVYNEDSTDINYYNVDQSINQQNDKEENHATLLGVKHYLLKSSGHDYSSKQKDIADDKKFVKSDNKKNYKYVWETTESPLNKNEISKQVSWNENKTKVEYDDKNVDNVRNGEIIISPPDVFKIFKKDKIDLPQVKPIKYDDLVVEDMDHVDGPSFTPSNKYDKIVIKDGQTIDNGEFYGVYKNDNNKDFFKVVPVTKSPVPNTNANQIYKYIMRVIHNDSNNDIIDTKTYDY